MTIIVVCQNGKIYPVKVTKVYGREEILAPLFLNLGTRWRSVINFMSRERTYIRTTTFKIKHIHM
jgi:hypothetical protein